MVKKINLQKDLLVTHKTKVLIVGCCEGKLEQTVQELDSRLQGMITDCKKDKSFTGKRNQLKIITPQQKITATYLLLVGLGKKNAITLEIFRQASGNAVKSAKQFKSKQISIAFFHCIPSQFSTASSVQAIVEGACLSLYSFSEYKTDTTKKNISVEQITLVSPENIKKAEVEKGIGYGEKISEAVYCARDLVSRPGNVATPTHLSQRAKSIAKKYKLNCSILDVKQMEKLQMGAFLGVSKGSNEPPACIILEYWGQSKKEAPTVFVGKGLTFDSGGISLKPSKGMEEMKFDMAGGAAVMGAIQACAALKLPVNVISIIPATENLPDGLANKPGDVLRSMSGKTIEVISTDAEGRLILADALTYAKRYKPKVVIDVATLTGACIVALGNITTAILGNDDAVISAIKKAGMTCGERVWELPLWEEYCELIDSDIADMKNSGGGSAGTITAAAFLQKFTGSFKWAHLDIAGTAWSNKDFPYSPKGATGVGVRLLCQYLVDQGLGKK